MSSETMPRWVATTPSRTFTRPTMLKTDHLPRPSRRGHHSPEFTFVPADYTVECSDEMPMDDATAADNCGEVTIEVSSETTAGDAAGNYTIAHVHCDRRCWKQRFSYADHHRPGHHSAGVHLRPCRLRG